MYLLENTPEAEEMRQNLHRLLDSGEEAHVLVALQLMREGGLPVDVYAKVWFKTFQGASLRTPALALLRARLPAELYDILKQARKYKESLVKFLEKHFDKLIEFEGFEVSKCVEMIFYLSKNVFRERQITSIAFLLQHPKVSRKQVLSFLIKDSYYEYGLDLSSVSITELPPEIEAFPELRTIIITNSNIISLPDSFYELPNLEAFHFSETPLKENEAVFWQELEKRNVALYIRILYDSVRMEYDYEKKCEIIEKILRVAPFSIQLAVEYVTMCRTVHLHQKNIDFYKKYEVQIFTSEPTPEMLYQILRDVSRAYATLNMLDEAIKISLKALDANHKTEILLRHISQLCLEKGDFEKADVYAQKHLQTYENENSYWTLITLYDACNDMDNLLKYTAMGLQKFPDSLNLWKRQYTVYRAAGKESEAIATMETVIKKVRLVDDVAWVVQALYENKDWEKLFAYCETPQFIPSSAFGKGLYLGLAYLRTQQLDKAKNVFWDCYKKYQTKWEFSYYLSATIALQQRKEAMLRFLQKAIDMNSACKEQARQDEDFKNYWEDEDFLRLVA